MEAALSLAGHVKQDKICKASLNKTSSPFGIKHRDMKGKMNNLRQIHLKDGMSFLKSLFGLLQLELSSIIKTKSKTVKVRTQIQGKGRNASQWRHEDCFYSVQKIMTETVLVLSLWNSFCPIPSFYFDQQDFFFFSDGFEEIKIVKITVIV